jgi:hypothetical protein
MPFFAERISCNEGKTFLKTVKNNRLEKGEVDSLRTK